jgi:hypothetical protein
LIPPYVDESGRLEGRPGFSAIGAKPDTAFYEALFMHLHLSTELA